MDDKQFDELLESVRDMGHHMHLKTVIGVKTTEFTKSDNIAVHAQIDLQQTPKADSARKHRPALQR